MMRWKILELAEQYGALDDLLAVLAQHPEWGLIPEQGQTSKQNLTEDRALDLLWQYKDILPAPLRQELEQKAPQ